MSQTKEVKDYYAILGVNTEATEAEIDQAYNRLAVQNHPGKNQTQGISAQKKFKDVCQAYQVLGSKNKRVHYDNLIKGEFSVEQAQKTFEDFYNQFGVQNEEEKQFFEENYPHTTKNYYHILGVHNHASLSEIQEAYRKLALKYHPKKNPQNQEAKKKFVEINQAYNALSCDKKRREYNSLTLKSLEPLRAHDIFQHFFSDKTFKNAQDEEFFRPMIQTRWIKNLDKLMNDELHQPIHQNSQTRRVHQVYSNKNGVESRKVVKQHKKVNDGKAHSEVTEQYTLPNGQKEVRKTIKDGDKEEKQIYHLKKDEEIPKELENGNV